MPAALAHFVEAVVRLLPELFLKATLVLAAAGALALSLRRAPAAARHLVWAAAVAGVLMLPFTPLLFPFRLGVLPSFLRSAPAPRTWTVEPAVAAPPAPAAAAEAASGEATTVAPVVADVAPPAPAAIASPAPAVVAQPGEPAPAPEAVAVAPTVEAMGTPAALAPPAEAPRAWRLADVPWQQLLIGVWLLGAAVLAVRLLVGMATIWWLARTGETVTDEGWTSLAARLSREVWLKGGVRLIRSRWTEMPMTWGVFNPVVLLPAGADEWPLERREVVLMHELAHVVRRDVLTLAIAQLAVALHWFNPLSWIALRELRAEAEKCADDWVLRYGTRASTYADHLLDMVRVVGRARVPEALALPMAQRSTFEGRLLAILEPGVDRGILRRGQAALTVLGLAGLVVLLGAMRPAEARTAEAGGEWTPAPELLAGRAPAATPPVVDYAKEMAPAGETETAAAPSAVAAGTPAELSPEAAAAVSALTAAAATPPAAASGSTAPAPQEGRGTALARLVATLRDPVAQVRVSAVQALGSMSGLDPRSVAALIEALRTDQDETVRTTAAWALGQIENRTATPALVSAMTGDRSVSVRRTAAWALGQMEDPAAVDGLARAMRDADAEVRVTAIWALGQIEDRRAVPALTAALRDGDASIRQKSAWALGQIEDRSAVPGLAAALRDSDREVRATAVWALGQIESPEAVPALGGLLRDADANVRNQAAWALGQIEAESAVQPLAGVVQNDASAEVRKTAVWALGQIEAQSSIPALSAALRDRDAGVRAQAAWAIGQVEPAQAPAALVAALRDDDRNVRRQAAWALSQVRGDPSIVAPLRAALRDSDPEVKHLALRALARTGDESAAQAVAEMLRDPDPQVRAMAAAIMGGHGGFADPRPEPRPRPRPEPRPRPMN
ncbi:MAG TPA: HEAT repeat domain-containing protein [Longimicrobium sp.]